MKIRFLLIFTPFIIFLISCDGKDRKNKSNDAVLKENKLLDSFSKKVTFIPDEEVEVKTDTLLNNGFYVEIKNWTDTLNFVTTSYKKDSLQYITNYRQFTADINISKNENSFFNSVINKAFLLKNYRSQIEEKLNLSNLRFGGAFLEDKILSSDYVVIALYLDDPISEILHLYHLKIFNNNKSHFKFVKTLKYDR